MGRKHRSWTDEIRRTIKGEITGTGSLDPSMVNNPATLPKTHRIKGMVKDLISQLPQFTDNVDLLYETLDSLVDGGMLNDRDYGMEKLIKLAAALPNESRALHDVTGTLVGHLWNNLQHPPLTLLGNKYQYRTADGSNNNILYPHVGQAGTNYARTVTPMTELPAVPPDAGLVFDTLFAREGKAKEHPSKLSSVLFYFASIIVHDLFRTDDHDANVHKTSSYLDLAPLYGSSVEEQIDVRTMENGLLKPDTFSEIRLLMFPPGVGALLVCFNRFHNYVAAQLAIINERGRFDMPNDKLSDDDYQKALDNRDEHLFQTARLVTCGLYVNIVLNDYVRTILNLNRSTSNWTIDPRKKFEGLFDDSGVPEGVGNAVSAEFNLIYRWHSGISDKDEKWTNEEYQKIFEGKDPSTLTKDEMLHYLRRWGHSLAEVDAGKRTFGNLTRKADGSYEDAELVKILTESTEDVAGAFGPRNIPVAMRAVECLGMEQARNWKVATLNEFRKFFKLEPHKEFKDISSDEDVQASLKALYGEPDYVELYPGLIAEDAKEFKAPSSGLCPGFTVSRTILADAVALTRGDRFYTVDYTPVNLTSWGFNQARSDKNVAGGGVIYKLLMRAFPTFYRASSVYALFPFVTPAENRVILEDLGTVHQYDFTKPKVVPLPKSVNSWAGVTSVLSDPKNFVVPWGPHTRYLTGHDYMLSGDTPNEAVQKKEINKAMFCPHHAMHQVQLFYEELTTRLVNDSSHKLRNTYQLNAIRDVGNPSHAIFVANLFKIPLKDADLEHFKDIPLVTTEQLYEVLGALFAYVFLDIDTASSFFLRETAKKVTSELGELVTAVVEAVKIGNVFGSDKRFKSLDNPFLGSYGVHMIKRLLDRGKEVKEVVWEIIPTAAAACATQAQGFAQMLDLYLSDEYSHHWPDIRRRAFSESPEDFEMLKRYALEGYRLAPPAFGVVRNAKADIDIEDGEDIVQAKKGDQLYTSFIKAGLDPEVFPDPKEVRLNRPLDAYIHHGFGSHVCMGRPIVEVAMAAQLKVFAKLKNLRRSPGLAGQIKSQTINGTIKVFMKEDWSDWNPFPVSMQVLHDGFDDPTTATAQFLRESTLRPGHSRGDSGVSMNTIPRSVSVRSSPGKSTARNRSGSSETRAERTVHRNGSQPPMPLSRIRATILDSLSSSSSDDLPQAGSLASRHSSHSMIPIAEFHVRWDVKRYLDSQFEDARTIRIADVVTTSGSVHNAFATTCKEYLKVMWPKHGPFIMRVLQAALDLSANLEEDVEPHPAKDHEGDLSLKISIRRAVSSTSRARQLVVRAVGSEETLVQVGEVLAWFAAAFSSSPYDEPIYCDAIVREAGSNKGIFEVATRYVEIPRDDTSCWLPLVDNIAIAHGFPTPQKGVTTGLEAPLQVLTELVGARHVVEYDGCLVLKGFASMLVPVRHQDDCIQWHLVSNDPSMHLSYDAGLARCTQRASVEQLDLEALYTSRAIVGWTPKAGISLKTDEFVMDHVDHTPARSAGTTVRMIEATVGLSQWAKSTANVSFTPRFGTSYIKKHRRYQNLLSHAEKLPIVLYGYDDRRGWLVPASYVLLHMIQCRNFQNAFHVHGRSVHIPELDDQDLLQMTAGQLLLENGSMVLANDDHDAVETLQDVVTDIWSILDCLLADKPKSPRTSWREDRFPSSQPLQGYEYQDIIEGTGTYTRKARTIKESSGGWVDLAKNSNALVLFVDGLGDVIKPLATHGLCHSYRTVPKDKDYLTTTVGMAKRLFLDSNSKIDRKHPSLSHLRWHQGELMFERCKNPGNFECSCSRIQQIYHVDDDMGDPVDSSSLERHGAIIFGQPDVGLIRSSPSARPKGLERGMYSHESNNHIITSHPPARPQSLHYADSAIDLRSEPQGRHRATSTASNSPRQRNDFPSPNVNNNTEEVGRPRRPSRSVHRSSMISNGDSYIHQTHNDILSTEETEGGTPRRPSRGTQRSSITSNGDNNFINSDQANTNSPPEPSRPRRPHRSPITMSGDIFVDRDDIPPQITPPLSTPQINGSPHRTLSSSRHRQISRSPNRPPPISAQTTPTNPSSSHHVRRRSHTESSSLLSPFDADRSSKRVSRSLHRPPPPVAAGAAGDMDVEEEDGRRRGRGNEGEGGLKVPEMFF